MKSSGQSDPFRHRQLPDPVSVGSLERPRHQGEFSVGDRAFRGRAVGESGVDAVIEVDSVPLRPGTRELAEAGAVTGDSRRNLDWAACCSVPSRHGHRRRSPNSGPRDTPPPSSGTSS